MTEKKIRALAAQALFNYQTTSMFTLMATCEYVVDTAVRDIPEITREARDDLWLRVWELTHDSEIQKAVEEKVAGYEASEEKAYVNWDPDNTQEENSVTLPDGSRIEVLNPMEVRFIPAASKDSINASVMFGGNQPLNTKPYSGTGKPVFKYRRKN